MNDLSSILTSAAQLFRRMDDAYQETAQAHGFVCRGCSENCCRSLFFHHTLVEHLMLHEGLARLAPQQREEVMARAIIVQRQCAMESADGSSVRQRRTVQSAELPSGGLCPLNEAGQCLAYTFRPMICRLHGVAHRLVLPNGQIQTGPGCAEFDRRRKPGRDLRLDRTPLYQAMAGLEQAARRITGYAGRRRMTIADMLLIRFDGQTEAPSDPTVKSNAP